jgi:hypothetical protein
MVGMHMKTLVVSLVAAGTLGVPAVGSAQGYRYRNDDRPSVVVQCAPGQRAVMSQRHTYRGTQTVARCVGSRRFVNDGYGRRSYARSDRYDSYRPVGRRSSYYERGHRRSKTKTTLMIAGSAATGAGVGGALRGKKGALIGAAIGGGAASIYEAAKRR